MTSSLARRLLAEFHGTAFLVTVVVGSDIAVQELSPDDTGPRLLENSTATVFELATLILLFGPGSGAHFNPGVSLADWFTSSTSFANPAVAIGRILSDTFAGIAPASAPAFIALQLVGLIVGFALTLALYPDADTKADDVVVPHPH